MSPDLNYFVVAVPGLNLSEIQNRNYLRYFKNRTGHSKLLICQQQGGACFFHHRNNAVGRHLAVEGHIGRAAFGNAQNGR